MLKGKGTINSTSTPAIGKPPRKEESETSPLLAMGHCLGKAQAREHLCHFEPWGAGRPSQCGTQEAIGTAGASLLTHPKGSVSLGKALGQVERLTILCTKFLCQVTMAVQEEDVKSEQDPQGPCKQVHSGIVHHREG